MNTPTCACCDQPYSERRCHCHENEGCTRCGYCVEHCRCEGLPRKREVAPAPCAICKACRFWEPTSPHKGECRRHAPHPPAIEVPVVSWPETFDGDWCGEFKRKDKGDPR